MDAKLEKPNNFSQKENIRRFNRKTKLCNYKEKNMFDGNCLLTNLTCIGTVVKTENFQQYVDSSGLPFKSRHSKYKLKITFKNTWDLKDKNVYFEIR